MQRILYAVVEDEDESAISRAACAARWIELERLKRDMRGVSDPPRLSCKVDASMLGKPKRVRLAAPVGPISAGPVLDAVAESEPGDLQVSQDETKPNEQDTSGA